MRRLVLMVVAVLAFGVIQARAGDVVRPFVILEMANCEATGYKVPFLGFGAGLDMRANAFLFKGEALYSVSDKTAYANLQQVYGRVQVLPRIGRLGLGGGITFSHLRFGDLDYERGAIRPLVSVAYIGNVPGVLAMVTWVFPGKDEAYKVHRPELSLEAHFTHHVSMVIAVSYPFLTNRAGNNHNSGLERSLLVKISPW
jgi:hypothetical protein